MIIYNFEYSNITFYFFIGTEIKKWGVFMKVKKDRRAQHSRNLIKQTYIALVQERGSTVVSITDIVARCNINRSTFYMHFQTKEHLQNQIVLDFIEDICGIMVQYAEPSPTFFFQYDVQHAIFSYVEQHYVAFHTFLTFSDSFMKRLSAEIYNQFLLVVKDKMPAPQIAATYYASVITGMIYHWSVETYYQYSAQFIAQETTKLFESNMLCQQLDR